MFIPDSGLRPPYFELTLGVIFISLGVVWTLTGEAWARFGRVVIRAKEPNEFWRVVVTCYLIGACLIGYFLYKVYGHSH